MLLAFSCSSGLAAHFWLCCCATGLGMNLVFTEVKLLLVMLLRGGYSWSFKHPDVLKRTNVFPGLKPAPGTDTLLLQQTHNSLVMDDC